MAASALARSLGSPGLPFPVFQRCRRSFCQGVTFLLGFLTATPVCTLNFVRVHNILLFDHYCKWWVRSGAARRAARPAFPFLPVRGGEALGVALAAFICELSSRCAGSKLRSREVPPAPRCALGMPRCCCCCCCALRSSVPGGGRGGVPRAPRHPVCCPAPPEGRDPTASLRRPRSAPREPSPLLALCLYLA